MSAAEYLTENSEIIKDIDLVPEYDKEWLTGNLYYNQLFNNKFKNSPVRH